MNTMISTTGASMLRVLNTEYKELYERKNFNDIAKSLLKKPKEERRKFSAEINSIESIIDEKIMKKIENLYILVSDTNIGKSIGAILNTYFKESKEYSFEQVKVEVITKLNDENRHDFKRYGLNNLVKKMAEIQNKHYAKTIINATGGYKAQIAFALALGQGMNIPVYYMFERFPTVIQMPPLPLTLDTDLYTTYKYFFDKFEEDNIIELTSELENEFKSLSSKINPFFDIEKIDNIKNITLSPMGQAFIESCNLKLNLEEKEISLKDRKNENIIFQNKNNEHHAEEIIRKYNLERELNKLKFIEKVYIIGNSLKERSGTAHKVKVYGNVLKASIYTKSGILDFKVETTAKTDEELILAKNKLEEFIKDKFKK